MPRRSRSGDPEAIRRELLRLIQDFETVLKSPDLRTQVLALVPANHLLRDLGVSIVPQNQGTSARDRILKYLQRYPQIVISGDELAVVSGISEYARRVRELRVQIGWPIYSGVTAREIYEDEAWDPEDSDMPAPDSVNAMRADDYILLGEQDRDAAHRWAIANEIRRLPNSIRDRILRYLRKNVGHPVTGEELKYVAKGGRSWPRRTRELRTEFGWPVATRSSGRPDLSVGVYLLEADRQSEPHDRNIPDPVRVAVLRRDGFSCRCCGWSPADRQSGDPRSLLELHHIKHHGEGGTNSPENLLTLCNVHHDDVHRQRIRNSVGIETWLSQECG